MFLAWIDTEKNYSIVKEKSKVSHILICIATVKSTNISVTKDECW